MRQGFRLLFVIAAVPVVSGCFYFPGSFGASGSGSESASSSSAQASVRGAIPALEAYYADNNTYSGVTLEALQQYDHGVADVRVVSANDLTYCLEGGVGAETYSKAGPAADILPGACPPAAAPLVLPEPAQSLHAAVRAMETYRLAHGSYEGMTTRNLRAFGVDGVTVAQVTAKSYCLEKTVADATWIARESGDVGIGAC